jgi:hypothetical protein
LEQYDKEILAKLLLSIGTRKRWRAADPISTARQLEALIKVAPQKEIAKKLGVSQEMIREFLSLLTLPSNVQELVRARKISIDAGYRLSLIGNENYQEALAKSIVARTLTTKEVRGIVQSLLKRNRDMSVSEGVELVVKYRPVVDTEDLVVTSLDRVTFERLKAEAEKRATSVDLLLGEIVRPIIKDPSHLKTVKAINKAVLLVLTKEGFSEFVTESKRLRIRPNDLMESLTKQYLEMGHNN